MKKYLTIEDEDGTENIVEEPQSDIGFTYADYLTWHFKERIELIRGRIFKMSPAPTLTHQRVLRNLTLFFGTKMLPNSPCQLLFAPVDVRLKGRSFRKKKRRDDEVKTVVQPDLIVVCDPEKLEDPRSIDGAPEMVIEVLSPGNSGTELKYKLDLYEENGVEEYWEVIPEMKVVQVFILENDRYGKPERYYSGDMVYCKILKGICIPVDEIFK